MATRTPSGPEPTRARRALRAVPDDGDRASPRESVPESGSGLGLDDGLADVPDAELLGDAADLGLRSVAELYRRHRQHALAVARSVLHDESAAEDVVQEVFISLPRRAKTFDPSRGGALQWLLRGVRNRAIDAVRQDGRRRALSQAPSSTIETEWLGSADPVAVEYSREIEIVDLVAKLEVRYAQLLRLAFLEGWSHSAIAGLTGLPLGTVKSRIRVGLRLIRAVLTDADVTPRRVPILVRDSSVHGAERIVVISQDDAWSGAVRAAAGDATVEVQRTSAEVVAGEVPSALFVDAQASGTGATDLLAGVDRRLHSERVPVLLRTDELMNHPEAVRHGLTIQDVAPSGEGVDFTTLALGVLSAGGGAATSEAATTRLLSQPQLDLLVGDSVGRVLAMTPSLADRLGRIRGSINDVVAMPRAMTEHRWREFGERGWWQGRVRLRDQKGATWESETTTWALSGRRWVARLDEMDAAPIETAG
jgi:RNA polymerase sigma-70 factor, ECF subfamily